LVAPSSPSSRSRLWESHEKSGPARCRAAMKSVSRVERLRHSTSCVAPRHVRMGAIPKSGVGAWRGDHDRTLCSSLVAVKPAASRPGPPSRLPP
jgi:hypothetical protein